MCSACTTATLEVEEGEILVLMGLSGSGKSTLLRAVNGLNKVARGRGAGRWRAHGRRHPCRCQDAARNLRQSRVAMVFQQFGLLPWRTVLENVGSGLELSGMPRASARRGSQATELVGLTDWADRKVRMSFRAACSSASALPAPLPPKRRSC
jgi:glycine betaine/proline transport system ATP-binding protein